MTEALQQLSDYFLQGLMQAALFAKTPALNAALRRVLDGFHGQKTHANVDALLLRLYEPILFRALSANNGSVRRNALSVLFDAFPLEVNNTKPVNGQMIALCEASM